MNKLTKNLLRIWISITSVFVFAVGWITLAHAQKPAPLFTQLVEFASTNTSLNPQLAPVPKLEELTQNVSRPAFSQPSVTFNMPRLRTRGS